MSRNAIAPAPTPSHAESAALLARARTVGASAARAHDDDAGPSFATLVELLTTADALNAAAARLLGRLTRTGSIERASGLPAEIALRLSARRARWDVRDLLGLAESLGHMPATDAALAAGEVSFSQARAIARAVRDLPAPERAAIDGAIAAAAPTLATAEPEALIERVEDAASDHRAARALAREQRAISSSFLMLQPALGGGGRLYGEADTERFATIAGALDAAAERPSAEEAFAAGHAGEAAAEREPSRARQRMDALVAICESHLAGGSDTTRPRPRLIATVDLAALASMGASEAARVLSALTGRPQPLTPLATQVLSCDAEVITVAFDGARPVAVSDQASTVPAKMRTAIVARDGGCRFPGCGAPASWCDVHHITPRAHGGGASESNLVLLCRGCHRRVHRGRWRIRYRPDARMSFTGPAGTFTSVARARRE